MADAPGKNFRKGISLIELFQFKIFIFFAHSACSAVVCSVNLDQPDAPFFFQNLRIPDLNITLVVGTLHSVYGLVCKRSVFWQAPITLEPLNEKSE